MDPERDVYKQIEAIVNESLLPQEYKIKCITKCESALLNDKPTMLHNDKCYIANGSHLLSNGN